MEDARDEITHGMAASRPGGGNRGSGADSLLREWRIGFGHRRANIGAGDGHTCTRVSDAGAAGGRRLRRRTRTIARSDAARRAGGVAIGASCERERSDDQ